MDLYCLGLRPLPGQALSTLLALPVCFLGFSTEHGLWEWSELLVCLYEPQGWVLRRLCLPFIRHRFGVHDGFFFPDSALSVRGTGSGPKTDIGTLGTALHTSPYLASPVL